MVYDISMWTMTGSLILFAPLAPSFTALHARFRLPAAGGGGLLVVLWALGRLSWLNWPRSWQCRIRAGTRRRKPASRPWLNRLPRTTQQA
jgi:hypothetical protein